MARLQCLKSPLARALALAGLAAGAAACSLVAPATPGNVPRLFIKDYSLRTRGEAYTQVDQGNLQAILQTLQKFNLLGVVYAPGHYLLATDPVLILSQGVGTAVTAAQQTTEPVVDATGAVTNEVVSVHPLFQLNTMTVSYNVPGFTIPPITITENLPIKSSNYIFKPAPLPVVSSLMQSILNGTPGSTVINGTMTISLQVQDLDPLALNKTFTLARDFPFVYTNGSVIAADTIDQKSGVPGSVSLNPGSAFSATTQPIPTPQAAPSQAAPSQSASASPAPGATPAAGPSNTPAASGTLGSVGSVGH